MSTNIVAIALLLFALGVGSVGLLLVLGLVFWFMRKSQAEGAVPAQAVTPPASATPPPPVAPPQAAAPAPPPYTGAPAAPPSFDDDDDSEEDESGATEVFSRDAHGRLMGWDDEDDDDDVGSTELMDRDKMAEYASLLEENSSTKK